MANARLLAVALLLLAALTGRAQESISAADPNAGWKMAAKSSDVSVYTRVREGSPVKEFKAVGQIDAATSVVNAVLDDFEQYPKFMPYTLECRLIRRDGDSTVTYQRISPRICQDRDYTLRVWKKSRPVANGLEYFQRWSPANDLGPPPIPHTVRVNQCEGSWLLEPEEAGKTRATYTIYTDTGGAIPPFLANYASRVGIAKIFVAVRQQVKNPKYQSPTD